MSQTRDQERFAISEVAADWQELMVLWHIMRPSISRVNGQLNSWRSTHADIPLHRHFRNAWNTRRMLYRERCRVKSRQQSLKEKI